MAAARRVRSGRGDSRSGGRPRLSFRDQPRAGRIATDRATCTDVRAPCSGRRLISQPLGARGRGSGGQLLRVMVPGVPQ